MSMCQLKNAKPAKIPKEVTIFATFSRWKDTALDYLYTACKFKTATLLGLEWIKKNLTYDLTKLYHEVLYKILKNKRYGIGSGLVLEEIWKSTKALDVDIRDVELGNWLMFQAMGDKDKNGNLNIRLIEPSKIEVLILDRITDKYYRDVVKVNVPKGYKHIFEKIYELGYSKQLAYLGRIYINNYWCDYPFEEVINCEVQFSIPTKVYIDLKKKYSKNNGRLIGGIDFNDDRINLAIVDCFGKLRDTYTVFFNDVTSRGCPREVRRTKIMQGIHEVLDYAYHHGVGVVITEDPEKLGIYKVYWIKKGKRFSRNWNYKVSVFASRFLYDFPIHALEYSMKTYWVDPEGTTRSKLHDLIMKEYGLDRHTASAYCIVLKALGFDLNKPKTPHPGERFVFY